MMKARETAIGNISFVGKRAKVLFLILAALQEAIDRPSHSSYAILSTDASVSRTVDDDRKEAIGRGIRA
ncbi:MAG: hypothetical protein KME45_08280 [Stenomitos rutilans HA7619-LM2]|jgi:hypothetical protein|nr:hypothetical protein [Stenomitos rutilans HA7619-LM2]